MKKKVTAINVLMKFSQEDSAVFSKPFKAQSNDSAFVKRVRPQTRIIYFSIKPDVCIVANKYIDRYESSASKSLTELIDPIVAPAFSLF